METYTSLIVEDVKDTSDYIKSRLTQLCPAIDVIDQSFDLAAAYQTIISNAYDILFLDIQMPTGTSFDLLRKLSEEDKINFEIIFITGESTKEYTLSAIKYSALDYLYKPLDDSELVQAVNKATERINRKNYNMQVQVLLEHFAGTEQMKSKKIAFHLQRGIIEMLHIDDIMYLQADGVVSVIHLSNGKQLIANKNLGFYKDLLTIDFDFKQLSNATLVNTQYIQRYYHNELTLTLTDGTKLYASRRYGKSLRESLEKNKQSGNAIMRFLHKFKN